MPIQVGPTSTQFPARNIPFVSVTLCIPGTTTCQTINNIQVDTGSMGLRILTQALSIPLPIQASGASEIGECVAFGSGSAWGSVRSAAVSLGEEPAVTVPIQIIDSSFGTAAIPAPCNTNLLTQPSDFSANGILGLAPVQSDSNFAQYFNCTNHTCTSAAITPSESVQNPVYLLQQDNNGVFIYLDAIPEQGAPTAVGSVVLGIGTTSNNDPNFISSGNQYFVVNADIAATFTTYKGTVMFPSLIDSGTNMLLFSDSSLNQCAIGPFGLGPNFYCPSPTATLSAMVSGRAGPSQTVAFRVADAQTLANSGDAALDDLAMPTFISDEFFWGLPFFYGKVVLISYAHTSVGDPPTWAYAFLSQNTATQVRKLLLKKTTRSKQ